MSNKTRTVLSAVILCVASVICITLWTNNSNSKSKVLFEDNAKFTAFTDTKEERFKIEETQEVEFQFESILDSGEMKVKIYDESNNIIYENDNNNIKDNFSKVLEPGTYYYYLSVTEGEGEFYFKGTIK